MGCEELTLELGRWTRTSEQFLRLHRSRTLNQRLGGRGDEGDIWVVGGAVYAGEYSPSDHGSMGGHS